MQHIGELITLTLMSFSFISLKKEKSAEINEFKLNLVLPTKFLEIKVEK